MDLICDTNIWYAISSGDSDPNAFKEQGHRLLATPISVLEIVSKIDNENFNSRQGAARAILNHADEVVAAPEDHLATLWGLPPRATLDWHVYNSAVATARDLAALDAGVVVAGTQKIRVDITNANNYRTLSYERFLNDVVMELDRLNPEYGENWKSGRFQQLPLDTKKLFKDAIQQDAVRKQLMKATFDRAAKAAGLKARSDPSDTKITQVSPLLSVYIDVYLEFMVDSACHSKPKENDVGDLGMFIYANLGRKIATRDKKWIRLAELAGYKDIIFHERQRTR